MAASFITFEGLDGSGKSTHLKRAAEWMRAGGLEVRCTHEPGGTPLGDAIRGLFLDPRWESVEPRVEALLVFASRRQHLHELVEPALRAGVNVLCDRFTDSSLAYQGIGRGLARPWLEELDRLATDGRRPDRTLLFDLPAETARGRGQSPKRRQREGGLDRFDALDLAFYRRVRDGFLDLARDDPERFLIIDSSGDVESTWAQVEVAMGQIVKVRAS
ncbi:MAG: dTMP kinase [bacterium]|nr:dTMP kinase [bacterium]